MNISLRGRVSTSFVIANLVVISLGFIVFHYLDSLKRDIEDITEKSNRVALLTDEIRISAVSILKYQRKILTSKPTPEQVETITTLCDSFTAQLNDLDAFYKDSNVKKVVTQMLSYVDSLKLVLSKAALFHRDTVGIATIGDLADKILEAFSEFQELQFSRSKERDEKIKKIIEETKRILMIILIIVFLFTIILALVVPGKIALPFKKIKDAIRELQDCNFDVSIYYSQDDEIGEIAREMNKMIQNFKIFEELRADKISVENRKFDALANMVKKPILVANAEGNLSYMNNKMYNLLQVQSEDVIGKEMTASIIPPLIIESFELAIKRRSKIENTEVKIPLKKVESDDNGQNLEDSEEAQSQEDGHAPKELPEEKEPEYIFEGYSNVMPIRGKDSSLDYYLMVLSTEVFSN